MRRWLPDCMEHGLADEAEGLCATVIAMNFYTPCNDEC